MVKSAINAQQRATNGLKMLLGTEPMAQVQANWRFLNNPQVTIKELYEPLVKHLEKEVAAQCIIHPTKRTKSREVFIPKC